MQDRFPEAAVRHYHDGVILRQADRYDNAMCHYAFSAECAIKAFRIQLHQFYKIRNPSGPVVKEKLISHAVDSVMPSLIEYHELLGVLDPHFSLLIGVEVPPTILFQEHPVRRYGNDVNYTDIELSVCESFTSRLVKQVIAAALDGRLEYESERGTL